MSNPYTIVGAGLAGCCLAWQLHLRNIPFLLIEDQPCAAGSLVAAGMLCPVTGKAFNPSWRIDEFYPSAIAFYRKVETILSKKLWYHYPVTRLFYDAKDRRKFEKKRGQNPDLDKWVNEVVDHIPNTHSEHGAVIWKGSGRLNVMGLVEATRSYFQQQGQYSQRALSPDDQNRVYTTGARGLVEQKPISIPHRSAKGEILTVKIPDLPQDQIISRGTWLVPTGNNDHTFLCGANYEWNELNNIPTEAGKSKVETGLQTLTPLPYSIIDHKAGVRPIIRRSEPLISITPYGALYLNGLGSKGTLYAPKTAEHLLNHLQNGESIPTYLRIS